MGLSLFFKYVIRTHLMMMGFLEHIRKRVEGEFRSRFVLLAYVFSLTRELIFFKNQDLVGNPSPDLFFHKALVLLPCGRIN